ncbi:MAG: KH domain-containing protein [Acidimicrobiales bacterium]|nr:KH domain-containing protein [Acidimicrobiales bacterium]
MGDSVPEKVLTFVASQLVDTPEDVQIDAEESDGSVDLRLSVGKDDMGRVIGRRGRNAQAIRTVVRAAGARAGVEASVDIVD